MKLILAPMEGLTDAAMRALLTRVGGYDWCVTEFLRVTDRLLPPRTFLATCPELTTGGCTAAGTPVHLQLLGSEPALLAENAARAAELGAPAIDLNFGCPAKTVNRHRGGAVLLEEPELVHAIVAAVRRAVPATTPVSAKMRLGVTDRARLQDNALGIEAAGASWLTVHARTKADGYRPPAYWDALAALRTSLRLPLIANGEIWSPADAERCRAESGCADLMLGRGAVSRPDLAGRIRGSGPALDWPALLRLQLAFLDSMAEGWTAAGVVGRYKQWLAMLTQGYPEAMALFAQVKRLRHPDEVRRLLAESPPDSGCAPRGHQAGTGGMVYAS